MVSLQSIAGQWSFLSEAALETFVWKHLFDLLNLTALHRQYFCQGEVCDILAIDANRQLHILELKNTEDRYLIQQLTRYYANLSEVRPFADQIDYALPIRLLAIAPNYHRHNQIDRQYNTLQFELWQFHLSEQESQVRFHLTHLDSQTHHQLFIPSHLTDTKPNFADVPMPPEQLRSWLGGCTEAEQAGILGLRAKLLSSSDRIQEAIDGNWIRYGSGKTKRCCEIYFQRQQQRPILFLWLPTPSTRILTSNRVVIGRLRVWLDGTTISHVGHVAEGLGKMKLEAEWSQIPRDKRPKRLRYSWGHNSHTPVKIVPYLDCREQVPQPDYWEVLAEMAIASWHKRL